MGIKLTLTRQPTVPLEAEVLAPNALADCSTDQIAARTVYHGKRQLPLADFFEIEGERSDEIEIHGDLKRSAGSAGQCRAVASRSTAMWVCIWAPT